MNWFLEFITTTFSVTAIILGGAYLLRDLLVRIATKSIDAKFDVKLEALRSDLRKSEQAFSADLKSKETQITSLRQSALAGLASRQAVLDKRCIEAVEKIWSSVIAYRKFLTLVQVVSVFNSEVVAENTKSPANREKLRKFFDPFALDKFSEIADAYLERPFLTPLAWALFDAYRTVFVHAYAKANIIKLGVGIDALDKLGIVNTLVAVLPHRKAYIEQYGDASAPHLIKEIEGLLLDELSVMLSGRQSDQESVRQAHEILMHAEAFDTKVSLPQVLQEFQLDKASPPPTPPPAASD